jgi:hypothetical protein
VLHRGRDWSGLVALARACRAVAPGLCSGTKVERLWTRRASSVCCDASEGVDKSESGAAGRKEQLCTGTDKLAQAFAKAYAADDLVEGR